MGGQVNRRYPTDLLVLWPHASEWSKIGKLRQPRRGFQAAFLGNLLIAIFYKLYYKQVG